MTVSGPNVLALLAFIVPDQLIARLEGEIDKLTDDTGALTPEERAEKIAALESHRLNIEREECAFIRMAAGTVRYRADTDPRAVLGLNGPEP
jgi:hypothetical protein